MLSHSRISTVGTNEDVTVVAGVVRALDHDAVFVLNEREDSLPEDNALPRDLIPEQVIKFWSRYEVRWVADTTEGSMVNLED